ncbi:MAG: sugar phosphate nucleotidyltransferase, partial [Roseburia sp.]|nr:sugar phosphate nucleotidyltransferase [Roseburia sp.]
MKVVILAGGKGTRISEESKLRPKPMVKIGGKPILWHIMKHYSHYGFHEFIVCCGYKGFMIKEYFVKYYMNNSRIEFHLRRGQVDVIQRETEPWKVTLV